MKFVNGVFGCALLFLAITTPVGCDYLQHSGPAWMIKAAESQQPSGIEATSGLLVIVCIISGIVTLVNGCPDPPPKGRRE